MIEPTIEEKFNGWTAASLERYRRERDQVANVTAGNVITEYKRPKPPLRIETATNFKPFNW